MNEASIFTLEKSRKNKFDISEYPSDLYVDTSAWTALIAGSSNSTSRENRLMRDFVGECLEKGGLLYSSGVVLEELSHIIRKEILDKEVQKIELKKIPRYSDGSTNEKRLSKIIKEHNPHIVEDITEQIHMAKQFVKNNSIFLEYTENQEMSEQMDELIKNTDYVLGTRDAKHVLVAHQYGINSFLTKDSDFTSLDNANIYVSANEKYSLLKIGRSNVFLPFDEKKY